MSDLRKAAEMALEALETLDNGNTYKTHNAASALRQALAQPEQEPVAWVECAVIPWLQSKDTNSYAMTKLHRVPSEYYDTPLYTAPPKREWVGLSSLDKTFLRTAYAQLRPLYHDKKEDVSVAAEVVTDWDGFFAAINDMLKEKNNG